MSEGPPAKRARKGTRSCLECRHRKVRCDWPFEGADTCRNCTARGLSCRAQEHGITTKDVVKSTSRSRIEDLESDVSTVWQAVQRLESLLGCTPYQRPGQRPPPRVEDGPQDDSDGGESTISSTVALPTHLGYIFDDNAPEVDGTKSASLTKKPRQAQSMAALKALLPPRDDMVKITARVSSWMDFNVAIFPSLNMMKSGEYMMSQYDSLSALRPHEGDLIAVAALLLSIGMTVQHAPDHTVAPAVRSIKDGSAYCRKVAEAVERLVLADDHLAGTMDGIELAMLYLRLQLSRTQLRKSWLLVRRVIALAEIGSLPRASMLLRRNNLDQGTITSAGQVVVSTDPSLARKAAAWEAICAVDRIYSVLWSLPLATSNHPLPKESIVDDNGVVSAKHFLYSLADIASHVIDLDQVYATGKPLSEQVDAVNMIAQKLHILAASTPQGWWKIEWPEHCTAATMQFWHGYLTVRAHFQLALASHGDGRFAANFDICLGTCQTLAKRYISLRPIMPPGFFANPVFDLQAFTAAIFLLLANYRAIWASTAIRQVDVALNTELTDGVLTAMDSAWNRSQATFARQGASAIKSLKSLFQRAHTSETDELTLTLPLLGKVRVSRKSLTDPVSHAQATGSKHPQPSSDVLQSYFPDDITPVPMETTIPSDQPALLDTLSFSMEYTENNPLLSDDLFTNEDWLSWSGW